MNSKALREQRGPIAKQIKDMAEKANLENRDFNAEEAEQWANVNKDYDNLTRSIDRAERAEVVEGEQRSPVLPGRDNYDGKEIAKRETQQVTPQHRDIAFQAWARYQSGLDLDTRHEEACNLTGCNPRAREFVLNLDLRANNLTTTPSAGGYIVPEGFGPTLETALLQYNNIRNAAFVWRTASGNPAPWPTSDDTSNKGALIGENADVLTQDVAFGVVNFSSYLFTSKFVKVSYALLEDSAFDLGRWIGERLGERLGRIQNDYHTTGTGTSQPQGIVAAATTGVTAAGATAITSDEVINLVHSVDPAYRANAAFMMNDGVLLYVRKLKEAVSGAYLWQPSYQLGTPDRLLGYPVYQNQSMAATVATGNKTMLFGDMKKFVIRDAGAVRVRRLDERFADTDTVAFVALMRGDSRLLDAGTHPVKLMLQP